MSDTLISQQAAGLTYGSVLEFLEIDLVDFGGSIYRIFNSVSTGVDGSISFLGEDWYPVPFESEGWGATGDGSTPRPTVTISDFDGVLMLEALAYDDLLGAQVRRYETTKELRTSGSYYGPEVWVINQKMEADGNMIKVGLATPFDQRVRRIPGWLAFRSEFPALGRNRF